MPRKKSVRSVIVLPRSCNADGVATLTGRSSKRGYNAILPDANTGTMTSFQLQVLVGIDCRPDSRKVERPNVLKELGSLDILINAAGQKPICGRPAEHSNKSLHLLVDVRT